MAISPLILLGAAGLGLLALKKKPPVLGDVDPATGAGSTVVKGPVTGRDYMVGLGEQADDGRQVLSVFDADGLLLLTALATPGKQEKAFLGRGPDAPDQPFNDATIDFNVKSVN